MDEKIDFKKRNGGIYPRNGWRRHSLFGYQASGFGIRSCGSIRHIALGVTLVRWRIQFRIARFRTLDHLAPTRRFQEGVDVDRLVLGGMYLH